MNIRFVLSIDHLKKKTLSIDLPYFLFIRIVTSSEFIAVLPEALEKRCRLLKASFFAKHQFFSDDYANEYADDPYIRFLTGRDIHSFLCKVMSLNYQKLKHHLKDEAGSFREYFSDLDMFWNEKFTQHALAKNETALREALFVQACVQEHYLRVTERQSLREKLGAFAKKELATKEDEIQNLKRELVQERAKIESSLIEQERLHGKLEEAKQQNLVLVPSDPYYMLGLLPEQKDQVDARAKVLLKSLHPDKTQSPDTAYLFDVILKSRDQILKR